MKLFCVAAVACCSSFSFSQVTVLVSGEAVDFPNTKPLIRHGRVMVPLRSVFEKLGARVTWYPTRGMAMVEKEALVTRLWVGEQSAQVNQERMTLDVAPVNIGGSIMVPLRFISETYGATVDWNQETSTVTITPAGRYALELFCFREVVRLTGP